MDDAFIRLVKDELGIELGITRANAKFLDVFEYFYDDCVLEIMLVHIVLFYELNKHNLNFLTLTNIPNINGQNEIF